MIPQFIWLDWNESLLYKLQYLGKLFLNAFLNLSVKPCCLVYSFYFLDIHPQGGF